MQLLVLLFLFPDELPLSLDGEVLEDFDKYFPICESEYLHPKEMAVLIHDFTP